MIHLPRFTHLVLLLTLLALPGRADELQPTWGNDVTLIFDVGRSFSDPSDRHIFGDNASFGWGSVASESVVYQNVISLDGGITEVNVNYSASASGSANFTTLGASAAVDLENYPANSFYTPDVLFSPVSALASYFDTIKINVPNGEQVVWLDYTYEIEGSRNVDFGQTPIEYYQVGSGASVFMSLGVFGPQLNGSPLSREFRRYIVEISGDQSTVNLRLPILSGRNYTTQVELGVYLDPQIRSVLTGEHLDPFNFSGAVNFGNTARLVSVSALDENLRLLPAANFQFGGQASGGEYPVVNDSFAPVPEPGSVSLVVMGMLACGFVARRRRSRSLL